MKGWEVGLGPVPGSVAFPFAVQFGHHADSRKPGELLLQTAVSFLSGRRTGQPFHLDHGTFSLEVIPDERTGQPPNFEIVAPM